MAKSGSTVVTLDSKQRNALFQAREKSSALIDTGAGFLNSKKSSAEAEEEEKKATHSFQPVMKVQEANDPQK